MIKTFEAYANSKSHDWQLSLTILLDKDDPNSKKNMEKLIELGKQSEKLVRAYPQKVDGVELYPNQVILFPFNHNECDEFMKEIKKLGMKIDFHILSLPNPEGELAKYGNEIRLWRR